MLLTRDEFDVRTQISLLPLASVKVLVFHQLSHMCISIYYFICVEYVERILQRCVPESGRWWSFGELIKHLWFSKAKYASKLFIFCVKLLQRYVEGLIILICNRIVELFCKKAILLTVNVWDNVVNYLLVAEVSSLGWLYEMLRVCSRPQ